MWRVGDCAVQRRCCQSEILSLSDTCSGLHFVSWRKSATWYPACRKPPPHPTPSTRSLRRLRYPSPTLIPPVFRPWLVARCVWISPAASRFFHHRGLVSGAVYKEDFQTFDKPAPHKSQEPSRGKFITREARLDWARASAVLRLVSYLGPCRVVAVVGSIRQAVSRSVSRVQVAACRRLYCASFRAAGSRWPVSLVMRQRRHGYGSRWAPSVQLRTLPGLVSASSGEPVSFPFLIAAR